MMTDQVSKRLTLRSQFTPITTSLLLVVVVPIPPTNAQEFKVSRSFLGSLIDFHGLAREDPYQHLVDFDQLVRTLNEDINAQDVILRLILSISQGNAQLWLHSLDPNSTNYWALMYKLIELKPFIQHGRDFRSH